MIPLNDLARAVSTEEISAMCSVAQEGRYLAGPRTQQFEERFAGYVGVPHATAVGSRTDALTLALAALDLGPDSRVGTVANAGGYSTIACRRVGARPVYIDVDPDSACMAPAALATEIASLDAVIVTHLYGRLAEMEQLREMTDRAGIPLIEDCAHSPGARGLGGAAGAIGDLSAFSFYPTKNLGAFGDAGMVLGKDRHLMGRVRQLANYGWGDRFLVTLDGGFNSRMDEVQAAVLNVRLSHLDRCNSQRRAIAGRYAKALDSAAVPINLLFLDEDCHVAHLAVVTCDNRVALMKHLEQHDVSWGIHYPLPDYRQHAWNNRVTDPARLPVTELLSSTILTIPCFPTMTEVEVQRVEDALSSFHPWGNTDRPSLAVPRPQRASSKGE